MRVEDRLRTVIGDIGVKALAVLRDYPLCDSCLGRLFGLLGRGFTNKERGRALKLLVVQALHSLIREGDEEAKKLFLEMAPNIGEEASTLYRELTGKELTSRECYVCGSRLEDVVRKAAEDAVKELKEMDVSTFVVAAHVPEHVIERENELKIRYGLNFAESIKAEIRREVSKLIQRHGYRPDFEAPDTVINVFFDPYTLLVDVMPLLLHCKYWKLARRVSQSTWLTRDGLKYPFAVELALSPLSKSLEGERVVLHAAGREDADVRMLGSGRPCIAEIKRARRRKFDAASLSEAVTSFSAGIVEVEFYGRAARKDVRALKEASESHKKVYKALVVVEGSVDEEGLRRLESFFTQREVAQRTPRRVRHRRADVVRHKLVYEVKARKLAENVFEALIVADAGLYIKELVDGDGGDTTPSFAEVLGKPAYCAELDVVYIIHGDGGSGGRGSHGKAA